MTGYKNYCVLKTCGILQENFDEFLKDFDSCGIDIKFVEENWIGTCTIINDNCSEEIFESVLKKITNKYEYYIYADSDIDLEYVLVEEMIKKGYRIGVAESITGGMICARLANVPGCSKVLYEGVVVYDSAAKVRRLHVKSKTIEEKGAVSQETLIQLLQGVLSNKNIDFAIATTGCAGPTTYSEDIPVGLTYIGVASRKEKNVFKNIFSGTRNEIRESVANKALFMLFKMVNKNN